MSQSSSQGSHYSNLLSQETLNQLFHDSSSLIRNVGLDQNSQGVSEFRSLPLDVQYSDNNTHENYEMTLQTISLMKQDVQFDELPSCNMNQSINHYPGGTCSTTTSYTTPPPSVSAASPYSNFNGVTGQDEQPPPPVISTPPPDGQILAQPLIVSNVDFPGYFGFDIGFDEEYGVPTKSTSWTYSTQLKKLFVKMRVKVPIRMKLGVMPQPGHYVRAVVVYKQPEYYKEVVERCPNHVTKHKDGHHAPNHLMRCENPLTVYETCPNTNRHYIKIPISKPQAGMDYFTEIFLFMCFSSCPGGLNRRPSLIIFTLENSYGQVCGRKVVNVRICACPGRDRINEEITETKRRNPSNGEEDPGTPPVNPLDTSTVDALPVFPKSPAEASTSRDAEALAHAPRLTKKRSNPMVTTGFEVSGLSFGNTFKKIKKEEDNEIFVIQVKGREKYEMLLKIKESLDLMDMVPQAQLDAYRRSCPPCGPITRTPQATQVAQNSQNSDSQKSTDSQEDSEGTPPSSQFPLSQLSSGSSGSAHSISLSQGSQGGGGGELSAIRFTLKRTVSLEKTHVKREDPSI